MTDKIREPFDPNKEVRDSKGSVWWRKGDHYTNGVYDCTVDDMRQAWESGVPFDARIRA